MHDIPASNLWHWGFLLPGPLQWALVAVVVIGLYGRSETARRGFARVVRPWTIRGDRPTGLHGNRGFLVVAACAAAAVAAWVVTWMTVVHSPPGR